MLLKEEIAKVVSGEVEESGEKIQEYSRDTSIFEVKPSLVVCPEDVGDVEKLVAWVSEGNQGNWGNQGGQGSKLSLTARAAGTDMTGGPLTDSILVSFTEHLNHISEIGNDYVIVEPGVYFRDLEKELLAKGLWYPPYPASKDMCAVGGIVNNDSGGEKTLRFGKTHSYVLGMWMVMADGQEHFVEKLTPVQLEEKMAQKDFEGEIYQKTYDLLDKNRDLLAKTHPTVTKNSSGYNVWGVLDEYFDLTQLLTGAQGTLGIMTKVKLRLLPKEKFDKLFVVFINDLKQLPEFTSEVMALSPTSLEITDDNTFKIYLRYAREMASVLGANGVFEFFKLFFPDGMMILQGGIPKIILLAEFEGNVEEVEEGKIRAMEKIVKKYHMRGRYAKEKMDAAKYWKLRRDTFKLLREKVKEVYPTPFIDDLEVHVKDMPDFWPKLRAMLDAAKIMYTISGHLGDGNLHIIPLMNIKDPKEREKIWDLTPKIYDLVLSYRGSISAEHNDGLIRSPYLQHEFGDQLYELFSEIKKIFDPQGIFNPHKKTDATTKWSREHVRTA